MKLVTRKPEGRFVFVGDTHGDLDASESVFRKYEALGTSFVFLGDYVDRGPKSRENVEFLFGKMERNPEGVYLLQGNHENYMTQDFRPADFWCKLSGKEEAEKYAEKFEKLPLVFSVGDIIALHGALPNIACIEDVENIEKDGWDNSWSAILWNDFHEGKGVSGSEFRPAYDKEYFDIIMGRLDKNVLIRSHQPSAKLRLFNDRCLTLFTSYSPHRDERTVAVADFDKNPVVRSIDDLMIEVV